MKQCPLQAKRQLYKCNGMETRPADTGAHGQRHKKSIGQGSCESQRYVSLTIRAAVASSVDPI